MEGGHSCSGSIFPGHLLPNSSAKHRASSQGLMGDTPGCTPSCHKALEGTEAMETWRFCCIGVKADTAANILPSQVPESRAVAQSFCSRHACSQGSMARIWMSHCSIHLVGRCPCLSTYVERQWVLSQGQFKGYRVANCMSLDHQAKKNCPCCIYSTIPS